MTGGNKLTEIEIDLLGDGGTRTIYVDVFDNSLSKKWVVALEQLVRDQFHLEKNFCFLGFNSVRNGEYLLDQVNRSIQAINLSNLGYEIQDYFTLDNCLFPGPVDPDSDGLRIRHDRFNNLHRYFEDLQGQSGRLSPFYIQADPTVRWHIRQLNLLCHEFESWALSYRKAQYQPEWRRPSQLMCWLHAPRFALTEEDYDLFGIETINRDLGGVYVGVNKAVGKHHWEVFNDEGRDSRIGELTTSTLSSQSEAAGDFDIEWGQNPGKYEFQINTLSEFRQWLINNNFDPDDKSLTIGHPQVGQVDLYRSFETDNYAEIWNILEQHADVHAVRVNGAEAVYNYHWDDADFIQRQVAIIERH